jgi:hypothetical protein
LLAAAYLALVPATNALRPSSGDPAADYLARRYGGAGVV